MRSGVRGGFELAVIANVLFPKPAVLQEIEKKKCERKLISHDEK